MSGQAEQWLIIGGSGGIGRSVAEEAARRGKKVAFFGRTRKKIRALRKYLQQRSSFVAAYRIRFGSKRTLQSLFRRLHRGPLPDVVVLSYGPFVERHFGQYGFDTWYTMTTHNLTLAGLTVESILPRMLARGSGTIVLLGGTDTDAVKGYTQISAYAAAKTGVSVVALSAEKAIREYERNHGPGKVKVLCVCPDYVQTEYLTTDQIDRFSRLAGTNGMKTAVEFAEKLVSLVLLSENGDNKVDDDNEVIIRL